MTGSFAAAEIVRVNTPDDEALAVHLIGSGPPLVCVPGGPARASAYLEDLAGLSESRTLVRIDLRGTGLSPLPADRGSLEFPRLADDIEAVREARGLEQIDVVAHSAGCLVASVYAGRYPHRVSRLVLVTPSPSGFGDISEETKAIRASRSGESWYADAAALEAELEFAPPHRRKSLDRGMRPFGYARWDERAQAHADSTDTQMSMRAMAAFRPDNAALKALDLKSLMAAATAEVLVVVGHLDGLTGVKAGYLIADCFANARVVEIPEAAHYPWIDTPERFRSTVLSFLEAG
jgi:pimeloyl-ACP methyl ester carboxylesterase